MNSKILTAIFACACAIVSSAHAGEKFGTAEEAREMLQRAVVAMEANTETALASFTSGTNGFRDRDLYVNCFIGNGSDAVITAHGASENLVGVKMVKIVDKQGNIVVDPSIVNELATEGEINTLTYWWPRPGEEAPSKKTLHYTKINDQFCGVGHYE